MRLGLLRDSNILEYGTKFYTCCSFLPFIKYLACHFESLTLFCNYRKVNTYSEITEIDNIYQIELPENINIISIYPVYSVIGFYKNLISILKMDLSVFRNSFHKLNAVIITIPSGGSSFIAYPVLRKYKTKYFTHIIGNQDEIVKKGDKYKGIIKLAARLVSAVHNVGFRQIIKNSSAAFCLSTKLGEKYKIKKNKLYNIMTNLMQERDIRERKLVPLPNKIKLLYVGRVSHEKGLFNLIRALNQLVKNEGLDIELTICGTGPELSKLKSLSTEHGLDGKILFNGFVNPGEELNDIYEKHHIFILPSISEGTPKVLLEAMAKGMPIIATRVGGIPDLIHDGINGILIDENNPIAIKKAIENILIYPFKMQFMSDNNIKYIRQYTAEKQAKYMANVIKNLVVSEQ